MRWNSTRRSSSPVLPVQLRIYQWWINQILYKQTSTRYLLVEINKLVAYRSLMLDRQMIIQWTFSISELWTTHSHLKQSHHQILAVLALKNSTLNHLQGSLRQSFGQIHKIRPILYRIKWTIWRCHSKSHKTLKSLAFQWERSRFMNSFHCSYFVKR